VNAFEIKEEKAMLSLMQKEREKRAKESEKIFLKIITF
jgi:hypothetical protein